MLVATSEAITHRTLAPIDLIIIAVYFVLIFGIGFYFSLKERTSEDYFLASRNIGWFAIGASLFVSNIARSNKCTASYVCAADIIEPIGVSCDSLR